MTKYEKDRLSDDAIANKRRYDAEYLKDNYKQVHISLPKETADEFKELIKASGFDSNADFIRYCISKMNEGTLKKED